MPETTVTPPEAATDKSKRNLLTRMIVLGFILAIIGGECLVACLYLPSVVASAPDEEPPAAASKPAESEAGTGAKHREVDLGHFNLTALQPASNTTLLIDFQLYGTVHVEPGTVIPPSKNGEPAVVDDEFSRLFEQHKHRFRSEVGTIVRSAEMSDFADPSLGLIRRKILEKSNRMFGKPLLEEVLFSDFSIIEQ